MNQRQLKQHTDPLQSTKEKTHRKLTLPANHAKHSSIIVLGNFDRGISIFSTINANNTIGTISSKHAFVRTKQFSSSRGTTS